MSESLKKSRKSRKTIVVAGTLAGVLVGGAAFAYWSTSGSGTGSATTSAGGANLTVTQTAAPTNLFPGDAPGSIAGTVKNNAENAAYVTKVVVSIASVTPAVNAVGSCNASDYTLASPTMLVNQDIPSGSTVNFSGATLKFNNKADTNQDGCKGATVNLAYAAS